MVKDSGSHRLHVSILAPWLAPAILSLYLKMLVLVQVGVCRACFRMSGQTWTEKLGEASFFRTDLLLVLFAVPAALVLMQKLLRPLPSLAVTAVLSAFLYVVLFAQLQCLQSVGTFVSLGLLRDALSWAWENPRYTGAYLTTRDQLVLLGGLVGVMCGSWWSARQLRSGRVASAPRRGAMAARLGGAAFLLVLILPWIPRVAATPYHRSALSWALSPSGDRGAPATDEFSGLSRSALIDRYREFSKAPLPSRDPRYWASMKEADILFFIFETGPAKCLDIEGDLSDFPNLRQLRDRSFVAAKHHSTAPVTNRALYSIFSSSYPSARNFDAAFEHQGQVLPGVISRAGAAGYETALYTRAEPGRVIPGDTERMRALGFQGVRYPPRTGGAPGDLASEIDAEKAALTLLKDDVARWAQDGRRFAAAFLPLVGHAPWPDPTGGRASTLVERGRALMALQDEWLGELMEELRRHNRLERTVIVVTADHGIRTRKEDPDFRLGMIDDYTFHVPLLIYAPQALSAPVVIPWVTSHVDVAPSVLDLLGLERQSDSEQGAAIWNPEIRNRVTFQPASLYLGSDGFSRGGHSYMYAYLTDQAYAAPRMRFDPEHALPKDAAASNEVIRLVERFNAFQMEWARRPLPGERRTGELRPSR